jgi:hypothetical protein
VRLPPTDFDHIDVGAESGRVWNRRLPPGRVGRRATCTPGIRPAGEQGGSTDEDCCASLGHDLALDKADIADAFADGPYLRVGGAVDGAELVLHRAVAVFVRDDRIDRPSVGFRERRRDHRIEEDGMALSLFGVRDVPDAEKAASPAGAIDQGLTDRDQASHMTAQGEPAVGIGPYVHDRAQIASSRTGSSSSTFKSCEPCVRTEVQGCHGHDLKIDEARAGGRPDYRRGNRCLRWRIGRRR